MRGLAVAVGAGILALLGSACAGSPVDQAGAGAGQSLPIETSTTPATTSPAPAEPVQTPPPGATAVPASQIDATALPEGYPRKVWTEGDGRTVGAVAQEGGCGRSSAEVAEQTDTRVVITLVETMPRIPQVCTMDLRHPSVTVSLDAPLAARTVVLQAERRRR